MLRRTRRGGRLAGGDPPRRAIFAWVVCLALLAPSVSAAHVYWSSLSGVGRADLDGSGVDVHFIATQTTCGVAPQNGRIFWGIDRGSIGVGGLDGSVLNGRLLDAPSYFCGWGGIAADSAHVYWANENQPDFDTIGRASLDGTDVDQRFIEGAINPCGVAVDSAHVYWATGNSGRGPGTTIGRANLDGTGVDENFITGLPGPCGVAVDAGHIYWGNMNTGTIGRANLNGSGVNASFITGATNACGVAVDSAHVYWEQLQGPIGRANLDGSGVNQSFIANPQGQCHVAVDALVAATVSVVASPASIVYGDDMAFTATVSGSAGTPAGTVLFQVNGVNTAGPVTLDAQARASVDPPFLIDVGTTISARYAGNLTYSPSRGDAQPDVAPAATATALVSSANPATVGGEVDLVATVDNLDTDVIPFGSVQFFIDGEPVLDPQPLDGDGQVGVTATDIPAGDYVVTAAYHDDTAAIPDFVDSQSSFTQHVVARPAPPSQLQAASGGPSLSAPVAARVSLMIGRHPTIRIRRGRFVVDTDEQAGCPAGGPACSVNVVGRAPATTQAASAAVHGKTIPVGRAALTIAAGRHAKLTFVLNKRGARLLRVRKRLVIRTTTTTRVGIGPSHSLVRNLFVRRPRSDA